MSVISKMFAAYFVANLVGSLGMPNAVLGGQLLTTFSDDSTNMCEAAPPPPEYPKCPVCVVAPPIHSLRSEDYFPPIINVDPPTDFQACKDRAFKRCTQCYWGNRNGEFFFSDRPWESAWLSFCLNKQMCACANGLFSGKLNDLSAGVVVNYCDAKWGEYPPHMGSDSEMGGNTPDPNMKDYPSCLDVPTFPQEAIPPGYVGGN